MKTWSVRVTNTRACPRYVANGGKGEALASEKKDVM